jgi:hypothetical protein
MQKLAVGFLALLSLAFTLRAGETYSGKEMKQVVPPPCPEWYGDTEWNLSIWGTYLFTAEDRIDDKYVQADHAWGGGVDVKYFFHRYFGLGLEGWLVNARRQVIDIAGFGEPPDTIFAVTTDNTHDNTRLVGAVKGTVTLRFPLHCSRFAPYVFGGAGAIFGGGEKDFLVFTALQAGGAQQGVETFTTEHTGGDTEFLGQVGAGFEVRFTRHVGWINDFSWNFVGRDNSDFGMVRSGVNFAF